MEVVDTDVMIDILRGHPPAVAWLNGPDPLPLLSGFALMELIQDTRDRNDLNQVMNLASRFQTCWPTKVDCHKALADFQAFHLSHNLGLIDSLIAATAVGLSATLYSFNRKHYAVVPGLVLAEPYVR